MLAEVSGEIGFGIGGNGGAAERFRGAGAVLVLDGARLLRNDFIMRICWAAADMFGPGRLLVIFIEYRRGSNLPGNVRLENFNSFQFLPCGLALSFRNCQILTEGFCVLQTDRKCSNARVL